MMIASEPDILSHHLHTFRQRKALIYSLFIYTFITLIVSSKGVKLLHVNVKFTFEDFSVLQIQYFLVFLLDSTNFLRTVQ
jgi:hypothetical protein